MILMSGKMKGDGSVFELAVLRVQGVDLAPVLEVRGKWMGGEGRCMVFAGIGEAGESIGGKPSMSPKNWVGSNSNVFIVGVLGTLFGVLLMCSDLSGFQTLYFVSGIWISFRSFSLPSGTRFAKTTRMSSYR